ncbi:aminotransferase class IV [Arsenicibacter rosenii]|uniref:branched-chain-amino-acid transaminase n=1 Tax=Arsenicibacter rosenii TaxID=1750698 RepID=A0A1S2VFF9_9BACT|nr:aminotransferase class IV [Arsenicibacter rosenii]OIN57025.1 aminotransferase IV [Arsenicibacter rosenii]
MYLVYNSDIVPETGFVASSHNRAFQYGDGLFETIRYEQNTVWFWPDHMARLSEGMQALHLNRPAGMTAEALYAAVLQLLGANRLTGQPARIKLQVWRQPGGLYTPATCDADWLLTARPGAAFAVTVKQRLCLFPDIRLSHSTISACKTLNALPYVLAGHYRQQQGAGDAVLLDTAGHLAECVASNLFWGKNGTWYTPSLQSGCINGIIRRQLLRSGMPVLEGLFLPDVLQDADVIFCANVAGIQLYKGTAPDIMPLLTRAGIVV